jgi:hypothetical protein
MRYLLNHRLQYAKHLFERYLQECPRIQVEPSLLSIKTVSLLSIPKSSTIETIDVAAK